jgi:hypothetical protein
MLLFPMIYSLSWRKWGAGGLWTEVAGMHTGIAMRRFGEARKGFALTRALWHWGWGLWCWRACGGGARPRPMEHDAQPYQCDQRKLVEEKMRYHGKTPSYTC